MQLDFEGNLHEPDTTQHRTEGLEDTYSCHNCGAVGSQNFEECPIDNVWDCADCITVQCDGRHCSFVSHDEQDFTFMDGQLLCERCFAQNYTECYACNVVIPRENAVSPEDSDAEYCELCFSDSYFYCEGCNSHCRIDEMVSHGMCESCTDERDEHGHDYNYKPAPIFHGKGNVFMGVELEVDSKDDNANVAGLVEELSELDPNENQFYFKHDGSLNNGIEIVTHPCTLSEHMRVMPWNKIVQKAKDMDFSSHAVGTCGLHVHVGRTGLGKNQEHTIDNLIVIFWKLERELFKFSRRQQNDVERWAKFNHTIEDDFTPLHLGNAKTTRDRYKAINLQNQATIEFRLFRGTLKLNTIKATLQLVDTMVRIAQDYSIAYIIHKLTWDDVVNYDTKNTALAIYSKEKGLIV